MGDMKLGARNSAKDKERIATIKDAAKSIINTADELQPDDAPEQESPVKADIQVDALFAFNVNSMTLVKTAGDMELDVLLVPFGGPDNGKDTDGQFFSKDTNIQHEIYKTVPAYYYHGYDPSGKPQGDPEVIGMMHYSHTDAKGHWYRCILDRANQYAKRVWEAAKKGVARASSGTIGHIARAARDGFIRLWPVVEGSLIDEDEGRHPANAYAVALPVLKAKYEKLNMVVPSEMEDKDAQDSPEAVGETAVDSTATTNEHTKRSNEMEANEVAKLVADAIAAEKAAAADEAKKSAELKAEIDKAVKAKEEELEKKFAESNRLPTGVYVKKFADTDKFDGLDAADTAVMIGVVQSAGKQPSEGAIKALALKLEEDKTSVGDAGRKAMKAAGIKANELNYDYTLLGAEWIGIAYSSALWESIRVGSFVVNKLPSVEVPQGYESIYLPLESTDPVWYNVAEATSSASGYSGPTPTVPVSAAGVNRALLTLGKLGARVVWTGELTESSIVPFAAQMRAQLAASGAEYLESAIIDGDTETTDSTNINNIGGAEVTGGHYLVFNGFRKSCLVTTAANSRAGGAMSIDDFLETLKLMGGAGINALDNSKVSFIIDPNVNWKAMALPEVLTRDVFSSPTIEGGKLARIFGYDVNVSGSMHFMSSTRKANSVGKVNTTDATQNLYGAILAVRWDQWKLGWKRRMTMETTRFANSDTNEIVAMMRVGLIQRDTEASAITYGVTV